MDSPSAPWSPPSDASPAGIINPAVTIAYWVTHRLGTIDTLLYWAAQLGGAILAAYLLALRRPGRHLARRRPWARPNWPAASPAFPEC